MKKHELLQNVINTYIKPQFFFLLLLFNFIDFVIFLIFVIRE